MRKIKAGVLIDRLNVGGVEKIAIEQVIAMRKIGIDAKLFVLRRKGIVDNAFEDRRKKIPTIFLDDRLPSFLKLTFNFPVFHFFSFFHITYPFIIPFVVGRTEVDYFFSHGTYTSFTAVMIKKIRKINYSVFMWDPISYILERVYRKRLGLLMHPLLFISHFLDGVIVKNSDSVLVGGEAHSKFLKTFGNNIKTIPPAVNPIAKPLKKRNGRVLIVAAWKYGKSPEFVFELLEKNPSLRFDLVGKWIVPEQKKEFTKEIKKRKLTKQIKIIGPVSDSQLSKNYSHSQVVLQITDDRGFGMPALEAAGNGTPFVIPKGQGVCKLFKNKMDGYFVKEKNTEEIGRYLSELISNNKRALEMGIHGWQTVVKSYSWENHAQKLQRVLLEKSESFV